MVKLKVRFTKMKPKSTKDANKFVHIEIQPSNNVINLNQAQMIRNLGISCDLSGTVLKSLAEPLE